MTWRIALDKVENQSRMLGHDGRVEVCRRCQTQVACSMDMQPPPTQAGHQLGLRVLLPTRWEHSDLAVRVPEGEDPVV